MGGSFLRRPRRRPTSLTSSASQPVLRILTAHQVASSSPTDPPPLTELAAPAPVDLPRLRRRLVALPVRACVGLAGAAAAATARLLEDLVLRRNGRDFSFLTFVDAERFGDAAGDCDAPREWLSDDAGFAESICCFIDVGRSAIF